MRLYDLFSQTVHPTTRFNVFVNYIQYEEIIIPSSARVLRAVLDCNCGPPTVQFGEKDPQAICLDNATGNDLPQPNPTNAMLK